MVFHAAYINAVNPTLVTAFHPFHAAHTVEGISPDPIDSDFIGVVPAVQQDLLTD